MLKIENSQFEAFEKADRADFERRMLLHIMQFFPEHYEALQEEKTRDLIH